MTSKTAPLGAALGWPNPDVMETWWEVICEVSLNDLAEAPVDERRQILMRHAQPRGLSEGDLDRLADYWTTNAGMDALTDLATVGVNGLNADYAIALRPEGSDVAVEAGYDELDWYAFLGEHGTAWNGHEQTWQDFRASFASEAAAVGLAEPATGFIAYVESARDKADAFAEYGVQVPRHTTAVDAPTNEQQASPGGNSQQ